MTKKRYIITAECYDKRGKLLSYATNSYKKTHPIQKHFAELAGEPARIYLHAEILAILRAGQQPIHTLVIKNTNGYHSDPCPTCRKAIEAYGIKQLITTTART
jgi:deoxycytidylate deaminase